MAIKKQVIKSRPVVKVTFSVDAKKAEHVFVVGDFNNWNAEEGILSKLKSGLFRLLLKCLNRTRMNLNIS
ncbi:hypothetical protein [Flavobacterium aciduliphilum]|uniref:Putative carbohydrate-binding protein with CBM48 n=1 Tax=Flavobacterium aciduliphilum TaxID=1101402 RepID=A0A328YLZ0_9FLAO|nr:putative carbohydrate-binding protein with CBM48 [Flavobacterium aciduliphilum]